MPSQQRARAVQVGCARVGLINWLAATAIALALSCAHLLDGPSDIEAAADIAADVQDAQTQARAQALASARGHAHLSQPTKQAQP